MRRLESALWWTVDQAILWVGRAWVALLVIGAILLMVGASRGAGV